MTGLKPATQLAFSMAENKGVYALLLGSGLSRAAGIPTGWDITLDLIRRIAAAQGVTSQPDWEAWYYKVFGKAPNYSTLLDELTAVPAERRAILHSYIEPNDAERAEGSKLPTAAHYAIADLVRSGHIRVLITTNFDRLLENALRERGVEPTIIASEDALEGAEPLTHSACYLIKLHGDYKDARILNTESELAKYPERYCSLLDRIFDEYGLLVCGWSGQWDLALRNALLKVRNRRYPLFWTARGGSTNDEAQALIDHRAGCVVPIADADTFFVEVQGQIDALEQSRQPHPGDTERLIHEVKRCLAKPEHRIRLDDVVAQECEKVCRLFDGPEWSASNNWDVADFRLRIQRYEAGCEALACMVGAMGRWGDEHATDVAFACVSALLTHADEINGGVTPYLKLREYPAVLVFSAFALGAVRAQKWNTLRQLFDLKVHRKYKDTIPAADLLLPALWDGEEAWKLVPGFERKVTAFSDYLLALFARWGKRFLGLSPDFERQYARLEWLGALYHLSHADLEYVRKEVTVTKRWLWLPLGRQCWKTELKNDLIAELEHGLIRRALLEGQFVIDDERKRLFVENLQRLPRF